MYIGRIKIHELTIYQFVGISPVMETQMQAAASLVWGGVGVGGA
jgi:hypothetical protein